MARRDNPALAKVLDQFVTVRVVQMWGVDLGRFQFDWDLTWAAVFLNADGTVYARYGTTGKDTRDDLDGFRLAAEGALELHAGYPANAKSLAGKQPPHPKWPTAQAIPALKGRPNIRPANGERMACIHCHWLAEGTVWSMRAAKEPVHDRHLWAHPDTVAAGFTLKQGDRATVFASAGPLQSGDRILKFGGQPIVSPADVRWVLHYAEDGDLEAEIDRDGTPVKVKLTLGKGWRRKNDNSDRTLMWSLRNRLAGTGKLNDRAERQPPGGMQGGMGLRISKLPPEWVKDRNLSAAKALKDGDVIIGVDGRVDMHREGDFFAYLLQEKPPGSTVKLTIRRNDKTIEETITLP